MKLGIYLFFLIYKFHLKETTINIWKLKYQVEDESIL